MSPDSKEQDLSRVDHIIYGTPDLDATIDELEERFGIRATLGGRHLGEGTRNALYSLGLSTYLEIMGPDPDQPDPDRPRWLGLDNLIEPRLIAWAANGKDLDLLTVAATKQGIELGEVFAGGRNRPDGSVLSWRITDPRQGIAGGIVPFFIDWGETPHPSRSAVGGLQLISFRAEHPDAERVGETLRDLGLDLPVDVGPTLALIATLQTPQGVVELR